MALAFPAGPTAGQQYTGPNGIVYQWDSAVGVWIKVNSVQTMTSGSTAATGAARIPTGDTAARPAATLAAGQFRYNSQIPQLEYSDGTSWLAVGGGGGGGVTSFSGGTTGFTPAAATTGAVTLAGTLAITNGGTGGTTAATAMANLLPAQAGNSGKVLSTDGLGVLSWTTVGGTGTVTSVTGTAPIVVATGTTTPAISITDASTTAKGAVQLATAAEAATGTDALKALTPATGVPKDASGMAGAAIIPGGADGTRPGTPSGGMFRYNTDLSPDSMEFYDAGQSAWIALATLPQLQGVAFDVYSNFLAADNKFGGGVTTDLPVVPAFTVQNQITVPAGYTNFICYSSVAFQAAYDTSGATSTCFNIVNVNGVQLGFQAMQFGAFTNNQGTQIGTSVFVSTTSLVGNSNVFQQRLYKNQPVGPQGPNDSSLVVLAWTI